MLTGRAPFGSDTPGRHRGEDPAGHADAASAAEPEPAAGFDAVLARAMAKSLDARYETRRAAGGRPARACQPAQRPRHGRREAGQEARRRPEVASTGVHAPGRDRRRGPGRGGDRRGRLGVPRRDPARRVPADPDREPRARRDAVHDDRRADARLLRRRVRRGPRVAPRRGARHHRRRAIDADRAAGGDDGRTGEAAGRDASRCAGARSPAPTRCDVEAELVDVATGAVLWSERYSREPRQASAAEVEIARDVADRLGIQMPTGNRWARALTRQVDPGAYDFYLQARDAASRRDRAKAISLYRQAIGIDPKLIEARVGLSEALYLEDFYSGAGGDNDALVRARQEADAALAVDPDMPRAHLVAAMSAPTSVAAASSLAKTLSRRPVQRRGLAPRGRPGDRVRPRARHRLLSPVARTRAGQRRQPPRHRRGLRDAREPGRGRACAGGGRGSPAGSPVVGADARALRDRPRQLRQGGRTDRRVAGHRDHAVGVAVRARGAAEDGRPQRRRPPGRRRA